MKKILAILVAFAMIFAFAACSKEKEEKPAVVATTVDQAALDAAYEEALKNTQAPVTEVVTEVETNAEGQTEIVTEVVTEAPKGLTSKDAAAIAEFYQKAVANTIANDAKAPAGKQTMTLSGEITGDGAMGAILGALDKPVANALAKNSTDTNHIPGGKKGDLLADDIKSATAISKDGKTTLHIELKDQVDGPTADGDTAGPVARGIGTLGNIDNALKELGAELDKEGKKTVTLTYTDAYIDCVIDEETGKIVSGTWHYLVKIHVGSAKATLGITLPLKNLRAAVEYTVII